MTKLVIALVQEGESNARGDDVGGTSCSSGSSNVVEVWKDGRIMDTL